MGFADKAKRILRELERAESAEVTERPLPYLGPDGDVIIPFNSDRRFWWWAGGQSTAKTIEEIKSWRH